MTIHSATSSQRFILPLILLISAVVIERVFLLPSLAILLLWWLHEICDFPAILLVMFSIGIGLVMNIGLGVALVSVVVMSFIKDWLYRILPQYRQRLLIVSCLFLLTIHHFFVYSDGSIVTMLLMYVIGICSCMHVSKRMDYD